MMQMSAPKKLLVGLAALATIFSVAGCEGDQAAPADSAPIQNAPVATPQSAPVVVEVEDEPELEEPTVLEADPASDSIDVSDFVAVRALLDELDVKGRAPKTGYDRDLFGQKWSDVDHNGCDTRNDVLNRDLTDVTYKEGTKDCVVLTGTLDDPYTASIISFQRGQDTSIAVQIDHVVALSDAWQKGAQALTPELRTEFANDPLKEKQWNAFLRKNSIAPKPLFHMDFQLRPRGRAAGHKFFTATGAMGEFGNAAQSCRNAGRAKRVS